MIVYGLIPHDQFRNVVHINMPFDTGNMFMRGASFTQSQNEQSVIYDTDRVPYIIFQEYGFRHYITKNMVKVNKNFIRENTYTDIAEVASYQQMGVTRETTSYRDATQARASMISNGLYEDIRQHGGQGSVRSNDTIGVR